jgi:ABC-type glutathione transport system ATPase component
MTQTDSKPTIGIVGPCGSGKTTLTRSLEQHQIKVRHIAQEHSYVPDMWQRISHPTYLVFLNVSFENATKRRKLNWTLPEYEEQLHRLRHAREHANLILETDQMSPEQVLDAVFRFIQHKS